MYNNVYQEYINNMIGVSTPKPVNFENSFEYNTNYRNQDVMNLEKLYPDLYKLLYPMIQKACMKNTKPLTEAVLEEMTAEIYSNFVSKEDGTFLNINLTNEVRSASKPLENKVDKTSAKITSTTSKSEETRNSEKSETRNFRPNNFVLRDLIRILLIRELIGRPQRPNPPPPPMIPGFPGGSRPPFRTNDYSMPDYEVYENPVYYSNTDQGYNIF